MDNSIHNLETAECCKNVIESENAGKMSFETTEVSPNNNNNKENLEIFDDSMGCDDDNCFDKDVNVRKDEYNQPINAELRHVAVTEEIPPKYHTPRSEVLSTFASPKSKKRKLSSFDELLENLHFNILVMNFTKLLLFLESNNKELTFPFIVKDYEEFFEMIVRDITILKSKNLDANYRDICDKIIVAATGYLLTCAYEYRQEFQKIVMVIKKEHHNMMDQSENGTSSFSCSTEIVMALSQTASEVDSNEILSRSPSPGPISSGFIIQCLSATLAFVKNNATKTKEFPELNLEQTQFTHLLLESVVAFTQFDSNLEMKELYRALWEAVRIYSLKYEFRIKCIESSGGKKSLVFEKVPKQKPSVTAVNSSQMMNPKTDVLKTEPSKPEASKTEAPKTDTTNTEASKTEAPKTDTTNTEASKTEAPIPEASIPKASKKSEASKPVASKKSEASKPVASKKSEASKPVASKKSEASKPVASKKSEATKPVASKKSEATKPEASKKSEVSKPEVSKIEAPIPEASKPKPWFAMPEIQCIPHVNQKPTRVTKSMINSRLKMENENLFIKRLPSKFISDTLNTIHEFLLDENRYKLVFVPNTQSELDFYRKCLSWCRTSFVVSMFGKEFQEMHYEISFQLFRGNCTVKKGHSSKTNETTGIKEVTYTKAHKNVPVVSIPEPAQSAPKKKKVNLQNALQLAETRNIKLESVINLNQSLRNKKKNKKLKKAKLKAKNNTGDCKEASIKPANQAKTWTDGSSSTCSSRGTSRDRSKVATQAQRVAKALNEINQSAKNTIQETSRSRRGDETIRKEQLIQALSVPVQSDKAMRMMRCMGWSGGALGARGNGITEPLMPKLNLARGAGLGHSRNVQSETIAKKPREPKTAPSFISENSNPRTETDKTENDVIVQKTNQLLLENPTFDSIIKVMEPQKLTECKVELPRQTKPLPAQTKTTVEVPKPIKANFKLSKLTTSNARLTKPLPTLTKFSTQLQKPENANLKFPLPFRQEVLHSILELFNSDATTKTLKYENKICNKARKFVKNAAKELKSRNNYRIFQKEEYEICKQIQDKYKQLPEVVFETLISYDFKTVELIKKVPTEFEPPTQQELSILTQLSLKRNTEIISQENLHSYIISSGTNFETQKAYEALKFKVLFLLNILSFVKSLNEEVEVTFNKVLNVKQKTYVQNVIDEVNMRIKFGSSPAETELCAEIKKHVKNAFLGSMFNHQYTVLTLNKYFRFKRLNRPDNAVKRQSQTTINLDAFSSETFSEPKLITNVLTDKENNIKVAENNKVTENNVVALPEGNEFNPYDSDNISVGEYNNNNCSVPKLLPGEDNEKPNTAGIKNTSNIKNDSAFKNNSNVIGNRNKNNIGNGNIVIDNNDNQVVDMKRDGGYTKNTEKEKNIVDTAMAEYVMCLDYTEEKLNSGEVNISKNKKVGEEIDQPIKHPDIVVANDAVEIMNQHKEIDNIDKMIDEDLSNADDTIHQNVIVVEDSDSNNDCTENIIKDEIQNGDNPSKHDKDIKEDTDVIMIEIDDEPMEVISITEETLEVIDKEDSVKVTKKEELVELINQAESMEEIYREDLVKIIDKAGSSRDVEVTKMEEENSINPSDDQIVKGDPDIKTDGDIISKEKLVLSINNCDTHSVGLNHLKTVDTVTDVPNVHINKDTVIKNMRIVHTNNPIRKLTHEEVKEIQRHISNSIVPTTQLPLLNCHGVQNGALFYSCHNKKTYDWLQNTISNVSYVKVLNTEEVTKMALKFYCFCEYDTKNLFTMIELYNQELSTKDWVVEKTEKDGDYVIFIIRLDKFSIKFIQESDLSLFAGIDKVQFSLIWE